MSETSARFVLPFLLPGQAQKEAFHNEALTGIDAVLHACVEEGARNDPPTAPQQGASWIVGTAATGAWVGQAEKLAVWTSGGWRFSAPVAGMLVWNKAAALWIHWTGSAWSDGSLPAAGLRVGGEQVIGPRQPDVPSPSGGTVIDAEARAAVDQLIATLKSHGLIE